MTTDLWDFASTPLPEITPAAVLLKEQADMFNLNMSAKGLYAEVRNLKATDDSRLLFALELVVPVLGDYRLRVVRCGYSILSAYPVRVVSEYGRPAELVDGKAYIEVTDSDSLTECLRSVFTAPSLRTSIASLIASSGV